jgi:hypothetical protein
MGQMRRELKDLHRDIHRRGVNVVSLEKLDGGKYFNLLGLKYEEKQR